MPSPRRKVKISTSYLERIARVNRLHLNAPKCPCTIRCNIDGSTALCETQLKRISRRPYDVIDRARHQSRWKSSHKLNGNNHAVIIAHAVVRTRQGISGRIVRDKRHPGIRA